ncbi:DUF6585 family protein [Actinomadura violacea]|uniref:Uncharacterized protein n=1 Tax=Actinomadura violacea TaxID=2819934 RepID=A0ABS3S7P1_9ACTN|nr:DUF6585 family protein [Actinomadura violacea]MBO2465014.1 hypothetical protein [Actinomadura violacea]
MELGLLPADSTWADLTGEARRLAEQYGLGEYVHPFPTRVGISAGKVDRVYQFRAGLVRQGFDNALQVFRWSDITTWHESVVHHYRNGKANYTHTHFEYKLAREYGVGTTLAGDYRDGGLRAPPSAGHGLPQGYAYNAVGRAVCDYLGKSRLPAALEDLQRGSVLSFGKYSVSLDGLWFKHHQVPWQMLESAEVQDGWFSVVEAGRRRPRCRRPVAGIPRYTLLRGVIDTLLDRERKRNTPRIGWIP